jgi:molybdenum cofactor biosynthesis enzyme MoaA
VRADLEDIAIRLGRLPGLRDFGITSNGIVLAKKLPGAPPLHVSLARCAR